MTKQIQPDTQSVFTELMNWVGSPHLEPQVKVEEWVDGDRRVIRADLPGIDPERDVELSLDGSTLHLRGQRRSEKHDHHRTEIRYGSFARALTLPPGTRVEDIKAEYDNGVLTVSVPVGSGSGTTTIPITRGGADQSGSDQSGSDHAGS
ncbi:Hsp20/alpha crystallin family protein [Nocardioides sp. 616]|uniref:Hsp20/alpha crystallin family protein n=1 Tax=Nocardioides sp. 616 TaxID=2268090 RepID=UPI001966C432|nr:Hsp20/alpha crystallin family protein [Nocardioides sp. 616]